MSTAASGFRELHQLHIRLEKINVKLDSGPKQIAARQNITKRIELELEAKKQELIELKKAADGKSLQMRINETKIADLKAKLNMASSNREFDLIKGQVDADLMANSVLEDEILELFEKVENAQMAAAKLQEDVVEAKAEEERLAKRIATGEPALKEEQSQLQSAIREAERLLPGEVELVYKRLVQAYGAGALAALEDGVCTCCYTAVLQQMRVELNSGKIVFCKSCGRLLYMPQT